MHKTDQLVKTMAALEIPTLQDPLRTTSKLVDDEARHNFESRRQAFMQKLEKIKQVSAQGKEAFGDYRVKHLSPLMTRAARLMRNELRHYQDGHGDEIMLNDEVLGMLKAQDPVDTNMPSDIGYVLRQLPIATALVQSTLHDASPAAALTVGDVRHFVEFEGSDAYHMARQKVFDFYSGVSRLVMDGRDAVEDMDCHRGDLSQDHLQEWTSMIRLHDQKLEDYITTYIKQIRGLSSPASTQVKPGHNSPVT